MNRELNWGKNIHDYDLIEELGRGGFGIVYRAKCFGNAEEVAVKVINRSAFSTPDGYRRIQNEISIHSALDHESIVKLYTHFECDGNTYIVLELCRNGDLERFVKKNGDCGKLSEVEARRYLKQVLWGMNYLRQMKVMHRDLKLSNLLLDDKNSVKIGDFGMATKVQYSQPHMTICGTANYMSPEMASGNYHNENTDIWSFGILLFTLLIGREPFKTRNAGTKEVMRKVVTEEVRIPVNSGISPNAKDLIKQCLNKDPYSRISIEKIFDHPFILDKDGRKETTFSSDSGMYTDLTRHTSQKLSSLQEFEEDEGIASHQKFQEEYIPLKTARMNPSPREFPHQPLTARGVAPNKILPDRLKLPKFNKPISNPEVPYYNKIEGFYPVGNQPNINILTNQRSNEYQPPHTSRGVPEHVEHQDNYDYQQSHRSAPDYLASGELQNSNHLINDHRDGMNFVCREQKYPNQGWQDFNKPKCNLNQQEQYNPIVPSDIYPSSCRSEPTNRSRFDKYNQPNAHINHENLSSHSNHKSVDNYFNRSKSADCNKYPHNDEQRSCENYRNRSPSPSHRSLSSSNVLNRPPRNASPHQYSQHSEKPNVNHSSPLSTLRLLPNRTQTKDYVFSLTSSREVFIEKLKDKRIVTKVIKISSDGLSISIFRPHRGKGIFVSNEPAECDSESLVKYYTLESLPESERKSYKRAKSFVKLLKERTPKVTHYSDRAKCYLMENVPPTFEGSFFSGLLLKLEEGVLSITEVSKKLKTFSIDDCPQKLSPHLQDDFNHFMKLYNYCQQIVQTHEAIELSTHEGSFPVTTGRRPPTAIRKPSGKENVSPSSAMPSTRITQSRIEGHLREIDIQNTPLTPFKINHTRVLSTGDKHSYTFEFSDNTKIIITSENLSNNVQYYENGEIIDINHRSDSISNILHEKIRLATERFNEELKFQTSHKIVPQVVSSVKRGSSPTPGLCYKDNQRF